MKPLSILIIDNSHAQYESIDAFSSIAEVGNVDFAEGGYAALQLVNGADKVYDIIFLDLGVSDFNGVDILRILARVRCVSSLIIASDQGVKLLSAVERMAKAEGLRVLGSLSRPLFEDELRGVIQRFFVTVKSDKNVPLNRCGYALSEKDLRLALSENRFLLHFQPQVDIITNKVVGAEALVRLVTEKGDLIYPVNFIHLLEMYGLINAMSYQVLEMALYQQSKWQEMGLDIRVSVNLSASSFSDDGFILRVISLIKLSGVKPENIVFEVTESAIVEDMNLAISFMSALRVLGCKISMDDYGAGYSSIKSLHLLPFTELKIDRTLTDMISQCSHLQIIYESTLEMCSRLGLGVITEGVECEDDKNCIVSLGGRVGQGYYFCHPLTADDFISWAKANMLNEKDV